MKSSRFPGLAAALGLAIAGFSGAALADQGHPYTGAQISSQDKCPGIAYRIIPDGDTPTGYVWFRDLSGLSRAAGTYDPATGAFKLTLTSIDGKGPTGVVEGTSKNGTMMAKVTGPGCSETKVGSFKPAVDADQDIGGDQH